MLPLGAGEAPIDFAFPIQFEDPAAVAVGDEEAAVLELPDVVRIVEAASVGELPIGPGFARPDDLLFLGNFQEAVVVRVRDKDIAVFQHDRAVGEGESLIVDPRDSSRPVQDEDLASRFVPAEGSAAVRHEKTAVREDFDAEGPFEDDFLGFFDRRSGWFPAGAGREGEDGEGPEKGLRFQDPMEHLGLLFPPAVNSLPRRS